jgi:integrase
MLHSNVLNDLNIATISNTPIFDSLRKLTTPYSSQVNDFLNYLVQHGFQTFNKAAISSYLDDQKRKTRPGRKGNKVTYSSSWYNQRLKAVKYVVRYLLDNTSELTNGNRYQIERYLESLKPKKTKAGISKAERVPNRQEVLLLVQSADLRLGLMIEFLAETGCRVSEMLSAERGQVRKSDRVTRISITGKSGKVRDLRCRSALFVQIAETFQGKQFLFEHGGMQYSRISVTNRIKILAEGTIGKSVTAHMLRHYRGTVLSETFGISKASTELGHADIRTTKLFYDHTSLVDDDFLKSLE